MAGVHSLVWEEAQIAAGVDPDFHRRDLADGIEAGASAFDGLLSIRCLALDGRRLRTIVEPLIETLTGRPLPRAWSI